MPTIQILTKNNSDTIKQAIESVINLGVPIAIGDMGSTDNTIDICKSYGLTVAKFDCPRPEARNQLSNKDPGWQFYLEPWEILIEGHKELFQIEPPAYVSVLNNKLLSKEIRFWKGAANFVNPVFEKLNLETDNELAAVLYSHGPPNDPNIWLEIEKWKDGDILAIEPFYYKALLLLRDNRYEDFLHLAEHLTFLSKKWDLMSVMIRYYSAFVFLRHKKLVKPALQNLNICLTYRPLMAEFWCLLADVYYHLLHNFKFAEEFYENAILLGKRRLKSDKWPMDLDKYSNYPKKMIASCQQIMKTTSFYS